jgi:hypothetical protein
MTWSIACEHDCLFLAMLRMARVDGLRDVATANARDLFHLTAGKYLIMKATIGAGKFRYMLVPIVYEYRRRMSASRTNIVVTGTPRKIYPCSVPVAQPLN